MILALVLGKQCTLQEYQNVGLWFNTLITNSTVGSRVVVYSSKDMTLACPSLHAIFSSRFG